MVLMNSTRLGTPRVVLQWAESGAWHEERSEPLSRKDVRKYPRVTAVFPVEYSIGEESFRTQASTLGGGGIFFGVQAPPTPGSEFIVRFRPAKHLPVIQAKVKVCYHIPGKGVAVEFTDISPQHRQLILRLIHHKTADKRKLARAPLAAQIECQQCLSLAFARDVSMGGMFIDTKKPLPVGSQVNLRFNLDDGGPIVVAVAEVVYEVEKLGMGIQFSDLGIPDRKRIEGYIKRFQGTGQIAPPVPS